MDFPTKQCTACKAIKTLDEFPYSFSQGKPRPRPQCRPCFLASQNARRAAKRSGNPPATKLIKTHHTCTRCGGTKPLSEFRVGTRRNGHEYPYSKCKQCCREMARKPRKEHKIQRVFTDPSSGNRMKQCIRCRQDLPIAEFSFANERIKSACRICEAEGRSRGRAIRLNSPVIQEIDRNAIIARDNSTCYLCGASLNKREITLDHVIPLVRGGAHTAQNLRVCCRICNVRKGRKLISEMAS